MYAHFKKLLYFSTECLYAPFAARGFARTYVKVVSPQPLVSSLEPVAFRRRFQVLIKRFWLLLS